jgi:hypothetical protein
MEQPVLLIVSFLSQGLEGFAALGRRSDELDDIPEFANRASLPP